MGECSNKLEQGPLIVKLRGSPLHSLPTKDEIQGLGAISHHIYLADTDFVNYILEGPEDRWPEVMRNRLPHGTTCLLGYPLPDPHLRLSFHGYARYQRGFEMPSCVLVDYPPDPYHQSLLKDAGVQYLEMSLSEFVAKLKSTLDNLNSHQEGQDHGN